MLSLVSGDKWNKSNVTFSFPDTRSDYGLIYPDASGFRAVTFDQQQAVRYILEGSSPFAGGPKMSLGSVESLTNLSFSYAGQNDANIRVGRSDIDAGGRGYYPNVPVYGGDVWLKNKYTNADVGSYGYKLLLHELGHALGLKHAHEGKDWYAGVIDRPISADRDSIEFTVMTYRSYVGGPASNYSFETYGAPQTFMMYDIAALQYLYGADFTTNSGNTVYRWTPTTGETFVNGVGQGNPGNGMWGSNRIFLTIWDGGGNDTYDLSSYGSELKIDLAPGGWSKLSFGQTADLGNGNKARGNVFNALQYRGDSRSLIENAYGGSGNDEIRGNQASNELRGNGGNDVLEGRGGMDTLHGGEGTDYAVYWNASSAVFVSLANTWRNTGDASGDSYISIEGLQGSDHADTLEGNDSGNDLHGRSGNDRLYGLDGRDFLSGGAGDDRLYGGAGADWLHGGAGFDIVEYSGATSGVVVDRQAMGRNTGDAAGDEYQDNIEGVGGTGYTDKLYDDDGAHELYGLGGNDELWGRGGNDYLEGGAGDDLLVGGIGADILNGGDGYDIASYLNATSAVQASLERPWDNGGEAYGDTFVSIEGLSGSNYVDWLTGNAWNNTLSGYGGNDELFGGGGADALYGGEGGDGLYGGLGADVLDGGAGHDFACYDRATSGVEANLSESWRNKGEAAGDRYVSIEGIGGSAYADALGGNEVYNELFGHGGNDELWGFGNGDWLVGGDGHDLLIGGAGSDWLTGGNGSDIFRFDSALGAGNVDSVNDFTVGSDVLQLTRNTFTAFANQGSVNSWQFTYGTAATNASPGVQQRHWRPVLRCGRSRRCSPGAVCHARQRPGPLRLQLRPALAVSTRQTDKLSTSIRPVPRAPAFCYWEL
ncbi:M10 family metallopeptidase C-terminal domain-containing protein [Microvirga sp. BT688]|uniref:M10 family metallopeptidase C-terminal domain-containing protein n=1 Tax=Microvirga sp. TaxID=1873136 RepID=UPI001684355E|nr:M10 family metallopeptidase [Microvirga sp.]MBD2746776.1 M10 family metallopeptidase C-terminal domain-containing protein [Microvirga sp.]